MKGVPIKFRGVRIDGNGFAYGDLEHKYNGREIWIDGWQVEPWNVAQLCGYDANGEEIYEEDEVTTYISFSEDGEEVTSTIPVGTAVVALDNAATLTGTGFVVELRHVPGYSFVKKE